jgi:hypothetical protein
LADVGPEEWAYMLASFKLDPYGDDWQRTSTSTAEIINAIMATARGFAGEDAEEMKPIPDDFIVPYREHEDPERAELEASLQQLETMRWTG